jgi:hypothetical protein
VTWKLENFEIMYHFALKPIRSAATAVAIVAMLAPVVSHAQDVSDSHLAAARSAIAELGATDPFDAILPATAQGLKGRLIANNPDLEQEISEIVDEQTLALVSRRGDLEGEAARIYASAFTEEELNAISGFYETEPGKKLLQNGPIIAREVSVSAEIWARGIERDLLENVVKMMNESGLRANTEIPAPVEGGAAPEGAEAPAQ